MHRNYQVADSVQNLTSEETAADPIPLVSLIIVNWNGRQQLELCLRSIPSGYPRVEVIVLDNGSTDGSQSAVRELFPAVRLIESNYNVGYALGNNLALNVARGEYLFFVNNDVIIGSDCIRQLLSVATSDQAVGILGGKVFVAGAREGTLEHAGGIIYPTGYTAHRGYLKLDEGQYDEICDVDYVIGAGMMVKRRVTDSIGLFDPIFPLYYEDTDLCQRARRAGFRVVYVPRAKIQHDQSSTTNKLYDTLGKLGRMEASRVYFVLKNFERKRLLSWFLLELWMLGSIIVRPLDPESGNHLMALLSSYSWNLRLLPTIIRRRTDSPLVSLTDKVGSSST